MIVNYTNSNQNNKVDLLMIALLFLFYLIVAVQVVFKPNSLVLPQFAFCLLFTLYVFNFHSHLVPL